MPSILIVEDEILLAKDVEKLLISRGYESEGICRSASEAVETALSKKPDLILMDIYLSGEMDGIEAAEQILAKTDIPIVYLTALMEGEIFERAKNTGPYGYLVKPVDNMELLRVVDTTLYKHASDRRVKQSEERHRLVLEHAGLGIGYWDLEGKLLYLNPAAGDHLDGKPEDFLGKSIYEIFGEAASSQYMERIQEAAKTRTARDYEDYTDLPSGKKWFMSNYAAVINESGEVQGVQIIAQDITELKRAQLAHQETSELMQYIIRNDPNAIAVYDNDLNYIAVSDRYLSDYNVKEQDIIGKHHYEVFPEIPQRWRDVHSRCLKGAIEGSDDDWFERPDGSITYNRWECRPWRKPDGEIGGIITYTEVTTERKLAEKALRDSEKRLAQIIEFLPDATMVIDIHGKLIGWNQAMEELTGVKARNIIGKGDYEYALPFYGERRPVMLDLVIDYNPEIASRYMSVKKQNNRLVSETWLPNFRNRGSTWLWNIAAPLYDWEGNLVGAIEAIRDITDLKLAEETLKESEERYRLLVENANEAIFVVQDGRFKFVNSQCARWSGYTVEELLAKSFTDLVHPENLEEVMSYHRARLQGDETAFSYSFKLVDKGGHVKWVNLNSVGISWQGKPAGLCCLNDITELKKAEELALAAERLKAVGELASGVAHNFNNLLQIVLGGAQLAITDLELGNVTRARTNLERIVESSKFGAETVKRLQEFARVRRNEPGRGYKVFDLADTVGEAIEMSKPWWKTRPEKEGISVTLNRYVRKGCYIEGNENELFEVVVNLIKNAAEALEQGGEIRIRTQVADNTVSLMVEDDGPGMSEKDMGRVFQPFWTTKGPQGTGMGLSSSYGIVRKHGGEITVDSEPGRGAAFTVTLPLMLKKPQVEGPAISEDLGFTYNILVVDDMPAVVKQIEGGLTTFGQNVYAADSGQQAIEIFKEANVDVVVCDLAMPEINGWEVAVEILNTSRKRGMPRPVFIMLTGWGGQLTEEEEMREYGVDIILEKPIDIQELLRVIKDLTEPGQARPPQ